MWSSPLRSSSHNLKALEVKKFNEKNVFSWTSAEPDSFVSTRRENCRPASVTTHFHTSYVTTATRAPDCQHSNSRVFTFVKSFSCSGQYNIISTISDQQGHQNITAKLYTDHPAPKFNRCRVSGKTSRCHWSRTYLSAGRQQRSESQGLTEYLGF